MAQSKIEDIVEALWRKCQKTTSQSLSIILIAKIIMNTQAAPPCRRHPLLRSPKNQPSPVTYLKADVRTDVNILDYF